MWVIVVAELAVMVCPLSRKCSLKTFLVVNPELLVNNGKELTLTPPSKDRTALPLVITIPLPAVVAVFNLITFVAVFESITIAFAEDNLYALLTTA